MSVRLVFGDASTSSCSPDQRHILIMGTEHIERVRMKYALEESYKKANTCLSLAAPSNPPVRRNGKSCLLDKHRLDPRSSSAFFPISQQHNALKT